MEVIAVSQQTAEKGQKAPSEKQDRLRKATQRILEDARQRPESYSEETVVPEGGE